MKRILRRAFERAEVHVNQTEAVVVAVVPLEVIHERPVEITAHIDSFGEGAPDAAQHAARVIDARAIRDSTGGRSTAASAKAGAWDPHGVAVTVCRPARARVEQVAMDG